MIERLPHFSELHIAALCASAGVVCNKADQDECGWDLFLQFPVKRIPGRPADMEPAGHQAFVQVKSTRSAPLTARMKLSNALKLSQTEQPCFVVLVLAAGEGQRIFVRHFWEREIARALKRVRLAEREGDTSFNRRHFDIQMNEIDAPDDLIGWMRQAIEAVKPIYAAEKLRIVNSVGHEDGFGSMTLSVEGGVSALLDLHLGLVDSVRVLNGQYVPQRFGIEAATPQVRLEGAKLLVEAQPKSASLRLQGGIPTEELLVDAECYSATLPSSENTLHRWRVDAGPLRIVGGNGTYSAKISMRFDAPQKIKNLKVFLAVADWRGVGPIGLQLFIEGTRVPLGVLTVDQGEEDNVWKPLRTSVNALEVVAKTALVTEPEISILELRDADPWITRFAGFVVSPLIRVSYEPIGIDDPARAAIYYAACNVGDWCFMAVVERNTRSDEMDGVMRELTFDQPRVLDAFVRRGCWRDHQDEIEAAYREQVARLGTPETLWEIGEMEAFVTKLSRKSDAIRA